MPNTTMTDLETLYTQTKDTMDAHADNPQLLLLIGIQLNQLEKVREAVETYGADPHAPVTTRNEQLIHITRQESSSNTALENMYRAMKDCAHNHTDNPQLLLLIAMRLNDADKIQEAQEIYNADPNQVVTDRNRRIMDSF
jgi:hypothetical protein